MVNGCIHYADIQALLVASTCSLPGQSICLPWGRECLVQLSSSKPTLEIRKHR